MASRRQTAGGGDGRATPRGLHAAAPEISAWLAGARDLPISAYAWPDYGELPALWADHLRRHPDAAPPRDLPAWLAAHLGIEPCDTVVTLDPKRSN